MERRSCIDCGHINVCSLASNIASVLSDHLYMLKNETDLNSTEGIAAALAEACIEFSPTKLDWKGGAS